MSSILTNTSSMVALQTLQGINKDLAKTQDMISTGLKIGSAKDNAAVWAISTTMQSDVKGFQAVSESLALADSTIAVARNASETVTDLLTEIKGKIVAAQEDNVDRAKIQADIDQLSEQVQGVIDAAQFNGLNLVDGSNSGAIETLASLNRTDSGVVSDTIDVETQNLTFDGFASPPAPASVEALITDGGGATNGPIVGSAFAGGDPEYYSVTVNGRSFVAELTQEEDASLGTDALRNADIAAKLQEQLDAEFGAGVFQMGSGATEITIEDGANMGALDAYRVELGQGNVGALAALDGLTVSGTDAQRDNALEDIEGMIDAAVDAAAAFGSAQGRIQTQMEFVSSLTDSLKTGIGALIDTNMEEASARLQALQVQQQLGVQALSIANQSPQTILSLFQ